MAAIWMGKVWGSTISMLTGSVALDWPQLARERNLCGAEAHFQRRSMPKFPSGNGNGPGLRSVGKKKKIHPGGILRPWRAMLGVRTAYCPDSVFWILRAESQFHQAVLIFVTALGSPDSCAVQCSSIGRFNALGMIGNLQKSCPSCKGTEYRLLLTSSQLLYRSGREYSPTK